jgi:hypothetical protein
MPNSMSLKSVAVVVTLSAISLAASAIAAEKFKKALNQ